MTGMVYYSDVGSRTGARAQALLDTSLREGVVFRETVPLYRVSFSIELLTRLRRPLAGRQPGGSLNREGLSKDD